MGSNSMARIATCAVVFCWASLVPGLGLAGGSLDTIALTDVPSVSVPGGVLVEFVPIFWDERCIPIPYTLNTALDPIPNPLGAPVIDAAQAGQAIQASMDAWNQIPTSFMAMNIVRSEARRQPFGADFVNEQRFVIGSDLMAGTIAASMSMSLAARIDAGAGMDLDQDGDADFAAGISVCTDVDGDGDIEFPAGTYEAGTILDNDVIYNARSLRFTVADDDVDARVRSVDLRAVATHELGHSQGLSHVLSNQPSSRDGSNSIMFPTLDPTDPRDESNSRVPDADAILTLTQKYPEGTSDVGIRALQPGDIAASAAFGRIEGSVSDSLGRPLAGASVMCTSVRSQRIVGSAFSGRLRLAIGADGTLQFPSRSEAIPDGTFSLLAPPDTYTCAIEAIDDAPLVAGALQINQGFALADIAFDQQNFSEESFNGPAESSLEAQPGSATPLDVVGGNTVAGVNFVTNVDALIANLAGDRDASRIPAGTSAVFAIRGTVFLAAAQAIQSELGTGVSLAFHSANYRVRPDRPSQVARFGTASIRACTLDSSQSLALGPVLRRLTSFVGQDDDFTPFYIPDSVNFAQEVLDGIRSGSIRDVCLLLDAPPPVLPGRGPKAPKIGIEFTDQPFSASFLSINGGKILFPVDFDFQFSVSLGAVQR